MKTTLLPGDASLWQATHEMFGSAIGAIGVAYIGSVVAGPLGAFVGAIVGAGMGACAISAADAKAARLARQVRLPGGGPTNPKLAGVASRPADTSCPNDTLPAGSRVSP